MAAKLLTAGRRPHVLDGNLLKPAGAFDHAGTGVCFRRAAVSWFEPDLSATSLFVADLRVFICLHEATQPLKLRF